MNSTGLEDMTMLVGTYIDTSRSITVFSFFQENNMVLFAS